MAKSATTTATEVQGVNRWFLSASAFGALTYVAWPEADTPWQNYPITGLLLLTALSSIINGFKGLRHDYIRRSRRESAKHASGAHGAARFATYDERERAGLHDPSGKMLLGEVDGGLPLFLPPQLGIAVQAPPGTGKTSALCMSTVLHAAQLGYSICVSDVKPEIVHVWKDELERRGFRVRINDPANIFSGR